jgi:hypothetical protein
VSVEAAQNPAQSRNLNGCADARIGGGLVEPGAVDGEALSAEQRDVLAQAQVVGEVELVQRALRCWVPAYTVRGVIRR